MNNQTANAIDAKLSDLREKASKRFRTKISMLARSHNAHQPIFVTDVVLREAAGAAQKNVGKLLESAVVEASAISATGDAFGLLKVAMLDHLTDLASQIEQWNGVSLTSNGLRLVDERLAVIRQDLVLRIEAHRYRFKNQGGRPSPWNWERARAHVRASFPKGLGTYRGQPTEIAEMIQKWFEDEFDSSPGRTARMDCARELIEELQRPRKIR